MRRAYGATPRFRSSAPTLDASVQQQDSPCAAAATAQHGAMEDACYGRTSNGTSTSPLVNSRHGPTMHHAPQDVRHWPRRGQRLGRDRHVRCPAGARHPVDMPAPRLAHVRTWPDSKTAAAPAATPTPPTRDSRPAHRIKADLPPPRWRCGRSDAHPKHSHARHQSPATTRRRTWTTLHTRGSTRGHPAHRIG